MNKTARQLSSCLIDRTFAPHLRFQHTCFASQRCRSGVSDVVPEEVNRSSLFPYRSKFSYPCVLVERRSSTLYIPRITIEIVISVQCPLSSSSLLLRRVYYCIMQSRQTLLSLLLTNPSSSSSCCVKPCRPKLSILLILAQPQVLIKLIVV